MTPKKALLMVCSTMILGCAPRERIELHSIVCKRVTEADRVKALTFVTSFETRGLEGRQLMYEVNLLDRSRRPIRSKDGRFESESGIVAATRSFMVMTSPQTFEDATVTIPAEELEIGPKDLPLRADVGVYTLDGEYSTRGECSVPIRQFTETLPPMAVESPKGSAYWFIKRADAKGRPTLMGPYNSAKDATKNVPDALEAPMPVRSDEFIWVVPVMNARDTRAVEWIGPFCCEEDAAQVAESLGSDAELLRLGRRATPPLSVKLSAWLERNKPVKAPEPSPTKPAVKPPTNPTRR